MIDTITDNAMETITDNEYKTEFAMPCTFEQCEKHGVKFQADFIDTDSELRLVICNIYDFTDTNDVSQEFRVEEKIVDWHLAASQIYNGRWYVGTPQSNKYQIAEMENLAQEVFGAENLQAVQANLENWQNIRSEQTGDGE